MGPSTQSVTSSTPVRCGGYLEYLVDCKGYGGRNLHGSTEMISLIRLFSPRSIGITPVDRLQEAGAGRREVSGFAPREGSAEGGYFYGITRLSHHALTTVPVTQTLSLQPEPRHHPHQPQNTALLSHHLVSSLIWTQDCVTYLLYLPVIPYRSLFMLSHQNLPSSPKSAMFLRFVSMLHSRDLFQRQGK